MSDLVTRARSFAAEAHAGQIRRGGGEVPYVTHCEAVTRLVIWWGGDDETIAASLLHDTVEDCPQVDGDRIGAEFGARVRDLVLELTDDTSYPDAERARAHLAFATKLSEAAALIRLADQTVNVCDVGAAPSSDWPPERKAGYLDHAEALVAALPGAMREARAVFAETLAEARAEITARA